MWEGLDLQHKEGRVASSSLGETLSHGRLLGCHYSTDEHQQVNSMLGANFAPKIGFTVELFDADISNRYLERLVVIDSAKESVGTPDWKKWGSVLESHDRFGADVLVRMIEI